MDVVGGGRPGGADDDCVPGVVTQQRGGELGAPGVRDAHEEHLRWVRGPGGAVGGHDVVQALPGEPFGGHDQVRTDPGTPGQCRVGLPDGVRDQVGAQGRVPPGEFAGHPFEKGIGVREARRLVLAFAGGDRGRGEGLQQGGDGAARLGGDAVVDPGGSALGGQHADVLEHLEVVGDGRLGDLGNRGDVAHARLARRAGDDQGQHA